MIVSYKFTQMKKRYREKIFNFLLALLSWKFEIKKYFHRRWVFFSTILLASRLICIFTCCVVIIVENLFKKIKVNLFLIWSAWINIFASLSLFSLKKIHNEKILSIFFQVRRPKWLNERREKINKEEVISFL